MATKVELEEQVARLNAELQTEKAKGHQVNFFQKKFKEAQDILDAQPANGIILDYNKLRDLLELSLAKGIGDAVTLSDSVDDLMDDIMPVYMPTLKEKFKETSKELIESTEFQEAIKVSISTGLLANIQGYVDQKVAKAISDNDDLKKVVQTTLKTIVNAYFRKD